MCLSDRAQTGVTELSMRLALAVVQSPGELYVDTPALLQYNFLLQAVLSAA